MPSVPRQTNSSEHNLRIATRDLLITSEAAGVLGLAEKTLEKDRCTRELGIPYVKLGRSVRYRFADLQKFIADRVIA